MQSKNGAAVRNILPTGEREPGSEEIEERGLESTLTAMFPRSCAISAIAARDTRVAFPERPLKQEPEEADRRVLLFACR
jgi:hypothetical protein